MPADSFNFKTEVSIFACKESIDKRQLRPGACNTAECGTDMSANKYRSSIVNTDTCSKTHILKVKKRLIHVFELVGVATEANSLHTCIAVCNVCNIDSHKKKKIHLAPFFLCTNMHQSRDKMGLPGAAGLHDARTAKSTPPCSLHSSWHTLCIWMRPEGLRVDGSM